MVLPTPAQMRGPYYPGVKPTDSDMDLTEVKGRPGRAAGEVIEIVGRVLSARGGPIGGATVEIWQADHQGRYHHPRESAGSADPNFQGFGAVRTTATGDYLFRTIRPRYYGSGSFMRTPHVHFRVVAEGRPELVLADVFPRRGDECPRRAVPRVAGRGRAGRRHTAREEPADLPRYRFEIVLA